MNFPSDAARNLIHLALKEDLDEAGDISSLWTIPSDQSNRATLTAKESGVIAGITIIDLVFQALNSNVMVSTHVSDGDQVAVGDVLATIEGNTWDLLKAERTLLNFLQRMCGVASLTAQFVAQTHGTNCNILDTRKTLPAYRMLDKYSVHAGGGMNHRIGLFDMVMLKDNHINASGGIAPAIESVLKTKNSAIKMVVEVETLEQLSEALAYPVDQIMLDNMDLETMKSATTLSRKTNNSVKLEASGNMTLERIASVAQTGVDFISVGALTHSVPALDISMRFN
ncbi:MAG: carboxylating nicotinate-nucleotide diphosphorylase [Fibrobacterales bacterium]